MWLKQEQRGKHIFIIYFHISNLSPVYILLYSDDFYNEAGYRQSRENDKIDSKYGFDRVKDGLERTGYLINMHTVLIRFLKLLIFLNNSLLFHRLKYWMKIGV